MAIVKQTVPGAGEDVDKRALTRCWREQSSAVFLRGEGRTSTRPSNPAPRVRQGTRKPASHTVTGTQRGRTDSALRSDELGLNLDLRRHGLSSSRPWGWPQGCPSQAGRDLSSRDCPAVCLGRYEKRNGANHTPTSIFGPRDTGSRHRITGDHQ